MSGEEHLSAHVAIAILLLGGGLLSAQDTKGVPPSAGKAIQDAAEAAVLEKVAQDSNQPAADKATQDAAKWSVRTGDGLGILTDTGGVDFRPYLRDLVNKVSLKWHAVIPTVDYAKYANGKLTIEFVVQRDGAVREIKVIESSGDAVMDRAARAGVAASSPLAALPTNFKGDSIRVRLRFHYNPRPSDLKEIRHSRVRPPL